MTTNAQAGLIAAALHEPGAPLGDLHEKAQWFKGWLDELDRQDARKAQEKRPGAHVGPYMKQEGSEW